MTMLERIDVSLMVDGGSIANMNADGTFTHVVRQRGTSTLVRVDYDDDY